MTADAPSVMLAAGGTGGHLFPAFALAEELARRGIAVDLMTDMRGDRYGTGFPARNVYRVPSATLAGRNPLAIARTAWMLGLGTFKAWRFLGAARPAAVIGFGGYPTLPPLFAARLRGIPTAVHEQNAVLGRANRLLAKGVRVVAASFDRTKLLDGELRAKGRVTGNPVRGAVLRFAGLPYRPAVAHQPFHLLIFGGSQGARFFSDTMPPALSRLPEPMRARLRVVHQAREEDVERVRAAYAAAGIAAEIAPFFTDLPERMAASHLVVGRAGASTVAELTAIGRPSILVPLPHALDNDQLQNATRLAESGAAWCIAQSEATSERLAHEIGRLMDAPETLAAAAVAAKGQGQPEAVARLGDLVEELVGRRPAQRQGDAWRTGMRMAGGDQSRAVPGLD